MKGGAAISCLWASFVIAAGIGLAIWSGDILLGLLLAAGGIPALVIALIYQFRPAIPDRRLSESGLTIPLIALGLVVTLVGLSAGVWLILIGAQVTVFGLVLLVRESRFERGRR